MHPAAVPARHVRQRMDFFRQRCAESGLAFTHQRYVIYRALAGSGDHPTPESVYEQVRREVPSISLGTVYKNIRTFLDAGLLREVTLLHESQRLDANMAPHHHLVCVCCRSVRDLDDESLEPVRLRRRLPRGFRMRGAAIELHGVCAVCARKEKKEQG